MRFSSALVAVGLLGWPASVRAQYPVAKIDSIFAPWRGSAGPGCLLGVARAGQDRLIRAYGMANLESGTPLEPESVSESGSVAKQFTAASVGLLAVRGKLSLDDDIHRYLPEVPDFGTPITIRHLLTHTSGLRDQWALLGLVGWPPGTEVHSLDLILDLVAHQRRLNFAPGAEYLYSNTGYALAALIVQRVSGKSLAEFSKTELFLPLGMTHTQWRDDFRRVVPKRATAYSPGAGGTWVQDMPFTNVYGNGGLLSTMADLLTWNDALSTGKIPGGRPLVELLETRARLTDGTAIGYALGLLHDDYHGVHEIGHGGATAGYRTYLARWPDRGLSVAVFCNAGSADPARYARGVADLVLGLEPPAPAPSAPLTAAELGSYAGRYRDTTTDQTITFAGKDGRLTVSAGGGSIPLVSQGGGRFSGDGIGEIRFDSSTAPGRVVQRNDGTKIFVKQGSFDSAAVKLSDYEGSYRSPELEVVYRIALHDGRLELRNGYRVPFALVPVYPDGFRQSALFGTIRFARGPDGAVRGFRAFVGRARDVWFDRMP
jgi:CubicO group peptidase (beta-lactamase class C family)